MHLSSYKAFGDELKKIAGISLDADTRANMAARAGLEIGKNYLPGGQLPSNDPGETNFVPKIASRARDLESKAYKKYKKYREPAAAAMTGAFPGAFLGNVLGTERMGKSPIRAGALLGAGAGLADWIASGKARKWSTKKPKKTKTAMMGSQTFSPGRSLMQSGAVGSFQDKVIHKGDRLRPLKIGQKFDIPSAPNQ